MQHQWDDIMLDIENNNIDKIVQFCKKIDENDYKMMTDKLIYEMKCTDNVRHRNTIAIVLSDLKCNDAIEEMIQLIHEPQNKNHRGTLVYALQNLDCEDSIRKIFHILFDGNYEVRCNMYHLLESKIEKMCQGDIEECLNILQKEKLRIKETSELIEDIELNIFGRNCYISEEGE